MLKDVFWINHIKVYSKHISKDKTIKYGLKLHDKNIIEGVLIPSKKELQRVYLLSLDVVCLATFVLQEN